MSDERGAERERVRQRVEARVNRERHNDKQVQNKVTSYFQRSQIQHRIDRDRQELAEAVLEASRDEHCDEVMHKNIVTVNNLYERRLVSAQLLEDDKRRHTSEDGESSSPEVDWTTESSSSNQAVP